MRIGLFCIPILLLVSCTDTPVEMKPSTFTSYSTLQIQSSSMISQNQSVTFSMTAAYRDGQVSRVAIYNEGSCTIDAAKVSEIANQVGATATTSVLAEGKHTFFYKPIYTIPVASLAALCLPAGLIYTVDRTVPAALGLVRTTTSPTVNRNMGLSVSGCENSDTGASSLLFTESVAPVPIGSEPGWESCAGTKTFTVSAALGAKNIYAFAKDIAGNISSISSAVTMTLSNSPNISTATTSTTGYINAAITAIVFTNSGGPIVSCTTDIALPPGLVLDPNTCQITGTPTATQPPTNYLVSASGAGATSNVTISIEVRPRPIATVAFNSLGAGPGVTTPTSSGGQTYHTLLNATVSGADVAFYKYYLDTNGTVDCATYSSYSAEFANAVPIAADLAALDGNKRLCVLGRNAAGIWQETPTVISWVQGPRMQNLSTDFANTKTINLNNQAPLSVITTRSFQVGAPTSSITCTGCTVSSDGTNFFTTLNSLASLDKVQFRVTTAAADLNYASTFVFNSVTFTINVKSQITSCSVSPTRRALFLTRNTISGNMGGISGANDFCTQEAAALGYTIPGGYKAMLSTSVGTGLALLGSTTNYCDLISSLPIISARVFQNPFYNFLNSTVVNGGGNTEWKFIPNAPRNITSTQFWYGKDTECNCSNWTTDSTASACAASLGSATGGRLTFDSDSPLPNTSLPDSGIIGGCSQKQHLVCFDPSAI